MFVTLEALSKKSLLVIDDFWSELSKLMKRAFPTSMAKSSRDLLELSEFPEFDSMCGFIDAFSSQRWKGTKFFLLFDEFDRLVDASNEVREDFLSALRSMKTSNSVHREDDEQSPPRYALNGLLGIGVYRITSLLTSSNESKVSPFNVSSKESPPDQTLNEVTAMACDYATDGCPISYHCADYSAGTAAYCGKLGIFV